MKCLFSSSFIPFSCLSTSLLKILFFSSYLPFPSSCFSSYVFSLPLTFYFVTLFIFFFANVLSFSLLFLVFLVSCHSLSSTSHVFPFVMHLHFSPHDSLYYSSCSPLPSPPLPSPPLSSPLPSPPLSSPLLSSPLLSSPLPSPLLSSPPLPSPPHNKDFCLPSIDGVKK